jgi:hypothetical protein
MSHVCATETSIISPPIPAQTIAGSSCGTAQDTHERVIPGVVTALNQNENLTVSTLRTQAGLFSLKPLQDSSYPESVFAPTSKMKEEKA